MYHYVALCLSLYSNHDKTDDKLICTGLTRRGIIVCILHVSQLPKRRRAAEAVGRSGFVSVVYHYVALCLSLYSNHDETDDKLICRTYGRHPRLIPATAGGAVAASSGRGGGGGAGG